MDWDRIKTIFIVTFLFWISFIFQFIQKQDSNQLELIAETKIDQELKANKITMGNFPKEPKKSHLLGLKTRHLKKKMYSL